MKPMELTIGSGAIALRVKPATVPRGGTFCVQCEVRFWNHQGEVYNPFLREEYKLPAKIVIVSADGKLHQELLYSPEAIHQKSDAQTWVSPLGFRSIGREFLVRIGSEAEPKLKNTTAMRAVDLPPGEYYVQAIYNNWLNAFWANAPGYSGPRPADGTADEPGVWKKHLKGEYSQAKMDEPIGISNPMKLTVTADYARPQKKERDPDCPIRVELFRDGPKPTVGRETTISFTLVNQSSRTIEVFAPYFNGLGPFSHAIELVLLTPDGNDIGDLWKLRGGSTTGPLPSHWLTIPSGGITSSDFTFPAGLVPNTRYVVNNELPSGKYLLELRIHEHVISRRPSGIERAIRASMSPRSRARLDEIAPEFGKDDVPGRTAIEEWQRTFPGPEICRSNRVELEILPRTGD
jgi:hypothetical protein